MASIVIIDNDQKYLVRLANAINEIYAGHLNLQMFSDVSSETIQEMKKYGPRIVLIGEQLYDNGNALTMLNEYRVGVLVENNSQILNEQGISTIAKYQRASDIINAIIDICPDVIQRHTGSCKTVAFTSFGGRGTTSIALAYAYTKAMQGVKTFYLDLEPFGSAHSIFAGEKKPTIVDAVAAYKRNSLDEVTCSTEFAKIARFKNGLYYFNSSENVTNLMSLESSLSGAVKVLKGQYNLLVVDTLLTISGPNLEVLKHADIIVFVSDGCDGTNRKVDVAVNELQKNHVQAELFVVYNMSSGAGRVSNTSVGSIGEVYNHKDLNDMLSLWSAISSDLNEFDEI